MSGRTHLVERAVEALQGGAWQAPPRPPAPPAPEAAPPLRPAFPLPRSEPPVPVVPIEALERAGLVRRGRAGARSRISEELALLRQQVLRGIPTLPPGDQRCARVVLVTSARPGEGKTFTALNLAAALADGVETPVLLVDADGRAGALTDSVGLGGVPGLRAVASAALPAGSAAQETAIPRLWIITASAAGLGSGEPLPAEAMAAAVKRLSAEFPGHVIVLDTPPALSTADAGALAPLAGQIVMVVRAQATQRNEIEAALDVIDACPDIRLLLNRSGLSASDSFGGDGAHDGHAATPAS